MLRMKQSVIMLVFASDKLDLTLMDKQIETERGREEHEPPSTILFATKPTRFSLGKPLTSEKAVY